MKNNGLDAVPSFDLPIAEFVGVLPIAGYELPSAVLYPQAEVPIRVFWQREVVGLLTGNKKGGLERYFKAKNLKEYIPEKYKDGTLKESTIHFKTIKGSRAQGFLGSDLIDICKMYMEAESDGVLLPSQLHLAKQAKIIVFAFAKTGVDAVIDEVTGFDKVRKDFSLIRNVNKHIAAEIQHYFPQFPAEFYKGIFRLNGWAYDDESIKKRSPIVGKWTNEIIYHRFPAGVLTKLQELNPRNDKGQLKYRNYNLLSEHIGLPALQDYISNAIFLMNASSNWAKFKQLLARALGNDWQTDIFDQE